MSTKILIVSYYWPPAGGIGVQRWLQFSKHLIRWGYEVIIYTPENPSYPQIDEELNAKIPKGITVIKQKIWEPYAIAEKLNPTNKEYKAGNFNTKNPSLRSRISVLIRGNLFIPDARKFWIKPSVRFLSQYIKTHEIENIITTGPPHSMHLIGLGLKKKNPHLNWIADFRDPWTTISYHQELNLSPKAAQKHNRLEKEVLQSANTVMAASFTDAKYYKDEGANSVSITNGYDTLLPQKTSKNQHFIFAYVGKLELQRNPQIVWQALEELCEEHANFQKDLQIEIAGNIESSILQNLKKSPLSQNLLYRGLISHSESQELIAKADLLFLSNFDREESKGIIPGKLFEYLSSGNPILSLGPEAADVSTILDSTEAGKHFLYTEVEEVKAYILQIYQNWKNEKKSVNSKSIEKYSRENQAKKILPLIKEK